MSLCYLEKHDRELKFVVCLVNIGQMGEILQGFKVEAELNETGAA